MLEDKNYINGTAARKLVYDVYEENAVLNAKKKQRNNNKVKRKIVLCLLLVFAMGSLAMYRYSRITEMNYEIDKQLKAYNELKNENIRIKVEIENSNDIQKIKVFAEKELGMHKPDKHQITYVRVPQTDLTIVSEAAKEEEMKNAGIFSVIINKVNLLANLLY